MPRSIQVQPFAAERLAVKLADVKMPALQQLQADGSLIEAYSPGGPGAILIFEADRATVEAAVASLPLAQAGIINTEIIELHPFTALSR